MAEIPVVGPALGGIAAAAAIAAGMVRVDQISNTTFRAAEGGVVPGYSPSKSADNIPAMLTAGERVLSVDQNRGFENLLGGLQLPAQMGGSSTETNDNRNFSDNRSFNYNNENTDGDSFDSFVEEQELMNVRMDRR